MIDMLEANSSDFRSEASERPERNLNASLEASQKLAQEANAAKPQTIEKSETGSVDKSRTLPEIYQSAARLVQLGSPRVQDEIGRRGMALDTKDNHSGRTEYGTYKSMVEILSKTGLAQAGWTVLQTEKNSPLDHMNVDYVLFNRKNGQIFLLDVTSQQSNQNKINHPFVSMIESKPSLFDAKTAGLDRTHHEAESFVSKTTELLRTLSSGQSKAPSFWVAVPQGNAPVPPEKLFPLPMGLQSRSEAEFKQEVKTVVDWLAKRFNESSAREKLNYADWMLSIEAGFNKWKEIKWKNPERINLVPEKVRNEFRPTEIRGRIGRAGGRFGAAAILIPPVWESINPSRSSAPSRSESW